MAAPAVVEVAISKIALEVALEPFSFKPHVTQQGHVALSNAVLVRAYLEVSELKDGTGTAKPAAKYEALFRAIGFDIRRSSATMY